MGGGESGVSQGAQVITRLSLHLLWVEGGRGVQNIIKLRTSEREIHLLPVNENFPQI